MSVYTISPSLSFTESLADGVIKRYGRNSLSDITILLPNRRLCRALQQSFRRLNVSSLPDIKPIGDIGEGEENGNNLRLLLTCLIDKWAWKDEFGDGSAARLAIELEKLINEIERNRIDFSCFRDIVPEEYAGHWRETYNFLNLIFKHWESILKEEGVISPYKRLNAAIDRQGREWQEGSMQNPVIIAGSTGSVPASAWLIKIVYSLINGVIILPGLDKDADDLYWNNIEPSHPQYGMKELLNFIGIDRNDVMLWQENGRGRERFVSEIMRPAELTDLWHKTEIMQEDVKGIRRIDTATENDESMVIALNMIEENKKGKKIALVTNERSLATKVSSIMKKWGVVVDDSAGVPIKSVRSAVFMRLIVQMIQDKFAPVSFLSCMKHDLAAVGFGREYFLNQIKEIELNVLRGVRQIDGLADIYSYLADRVEIGFVVEKIEYAMQGLLNLMKNKEVAFEELLNQHIECAVKLADTDEISGEERLFGDDEGKQFFTVLKDISSSAGSKNKVSTAQYMQLFTGLLEGFKYRSDKEVNCNIQILSPMEARMQSFDVVVLGGLNEGSWPAAIEANPWMNIAMQNKIGLPHCERRTGLSAHDFAGLLCTPEVLLTRCCKKDGVQSVASRWIMRMDTLLSVTWDRYEFVGDKNDWNSTVKNINVPDNFVPIEPPYVKPSSDLRPIEYSATSIEKLMRNPYAIYAEKILKLRPLEKIGKEPGNAEFGNFIHDSINMFLQSYRDDSVDKLYNKFIQCGEFAIKKNKINNKTKLLWWKRFERIALWFVQNELQRRQNIEMVLSEIEGRYEINTKAGVVTVKAKADRVEINRDGSLAIFDYKTGYVPSNKDIENGIAPQMIVEGLIASKGGFVDNNRIIDEIAYIALKGREEVVKLQEIGKFAEYIAAAEPALEELLKIFMDENTPYLSCPDEKTAPAYNDYKHLAREGEWR